MDGAILPLTFYCRNAQLCLAKAAESQKSGFVAEELQHLKTFSTLVSETIPSHPNFRNRQEDKQVLELHAYLPEAAKRIRELETSVARLQPHCSIRPQSSKSQGRPSSRHSKPPLASSVASRSPLPKSRGASLDREDRDRSLDGSNHAGATATTATTTTTTTVGANQDEEERSWNETSEDTSRGFRTGYGDESSGDSTLKHHRRKLSKSHENQPQRRGNGLREWKGDFVRTTERVHGERRHSNVRVDNRPASAPRRMQAGLVERKPKGGGENVDEVEEVSAESKHEKPAVLASRLQRGMKEECEHFRRDMRLLLEKAHDSRNRETEVESMLLRNRLVDEMDLASSAGDLKHRASSNSMKSPRMNRLRGGHPPTDGLATHNPTGIQHTEQEENMKPSGGTNSSRKTPSASRDTGSGSSSGSSMTSLPLSHYIQKLKKFSPDSQLGSANLELLAPVNKAPGNDDHHEKYEETGALASSHELAHDLSGLLPTTLSGGSAASAIFLPASTNSTNSPHGGLGRPSPRFGTSVLYSSLAHPGVSRLRPLQQDTGPLAMFNSNPENHEDDRLSSMVTPLNDQLLYPHFQNDTENDTSPGSKDDKLNSIQRVLGELRGSVKGMKIRLEVDGQGWRGRVEGLEKELESLKEEADDEIIAAKHSLRNEMKVKLGDLMVEMERIRRQERDEAGDARPF